MTESTQSPKGGSKAKATAPKPAPQSAPDATSSAKSGPQSLGRRGVQDAPRKTESDIEREVAALFGPVDDEKPSAPETDTETRRGTDAQLPGQKGADGGSESSPESDPSAHTDAGEDLNDAHAPDPNPDPDAPVTLAELAEGLEMDAKDMYGVMVPLANGESISIGELKDQYSEIAQAEQHFATQRRELDTERMGNVREKMMMNNVLEAIRPQLTPELLHYVQDFDRRVDLDERMALQRMVPELREKAARDDFLERAIKRIATETGRSEQEAKARLAQMRGRGAAMDVAFLHKALAAFEELDRLKGVKAGAERQKTPVAKRRGGPRGQADRLTTARNIAARGTEADKAAAVASLLGG